MLKHKLHDFCNRSYPDDGLKSGKYYGQYINQFPLNTIKVIREFERIQKKICRHKMSIMFNEICVYIYICVCVYQSIGIAGRVLANDSGWVIPKTQKMLLYASFWGTDQG